MTAKTPAGSMSLRDRDAYNRSLSGSDADILIDINYYIRMALIGDAGVGKTSILLRYSDAAGLKMRSAPDHSVDVRTKLVVRNGQRVKLEILDTAGMERYRSLTKSHYIGISGALLVFDLTQQKTFHNIELWRNELLSHARSNVDVILIGTRCHKQEEREVTEEQARKFADHHDMPYIEVSSERNINIELIFTTLVNIIIEKQAERVKVAREDVIKDKNANITQSTSTCCLN